MMKSMMRLCRHSADPCGVTDEKSSLYANQPLRDLLDFLTLLTVRNDEPQSLLRL